MHLKATNSWLMDRLCDPVCCWKEGNRCETLNFRSSVFKRLKHRKVRKIKTLRLIWPLLQRPKHTSFYVFCCISLNETSEGTWLTDAAGADVVFVINSDGEEEKGRLRGCWVSMKEWQEEPGKEGREKEGGGRGGWMFEEGRAELQLSVRVSPSIDDHLHPSDELCLLIMAWNTQKYSDNDAPLKGDRCVSS